MKNPSQYGWPPHFPLVQFPNIPLGVALAGIVAEHLTDGQAHDYAEAVTSIGIAVWAYEELADGDNWFRRVLGAVGLAYVVSRLS